MDMRLKKLLEWFQNIEYFDDEISNYPQDKKTQ